MTLFDALFSLVIEVFERQSRVDDQRCAVIRRSLARASAEDLSHAPQAMIEWYLDSASVPRRFAAFYLLLNA